MLFSLLTGAVAQSASVVIKEKNDVEMFIRQASKIKSPQINYAYISFNMLKKMFAPIGKFASIKSLRRFYTTGPEGKKKLAEALWPFMQESDVVMGMELMTINRESDMMSVIYAGGDNILVINDSGETLSVVFVAGLSYEAFKFIFLSDEFDFGF